MAVDRNALPQLLKRLLFALTQAGIRPSFNLGDALLTTAAVMLEKAPGGRSAFIDRAAHFWDETVAAGDADPREVQAVAEAVAEGAPTSREQLEQLSRDIGHHIAGACPKGVGFALHVFTFGEGGFTAWLSNARREDMVKATRDWLAHVQQN